MHIQFDDTVWRNPNTINNEKILPRLYNVYSAQTTTMFIRTFWTMVDLPMQDTRVGLQGRLTQLAISR